MINRILAKLIGDPLERQQRLINRLKSTDSTKPIRIGLQKIPTKWLRELIFLDPLAIFQQVSSPLLLVGGEKDIHCDPADIDRIANIVQGPVIAHVVANLTHVLRPDEHPPSILNSRQLIEKPMEPRVLEMIAEWLDFQLNQISTG